ncbi:carbohydrate kinase family protein [Tundrisphaera sp. TA3]|uniref:carbohydrate kinase family protein n=1 Tax=Tundrisphaera sp. TA3 TaxID=3435775 RepID=UPI003EB72CA1
MNAPESSACPVVCAGIVVADHLCSPISHLPAAGELVRSEELILNIGGCATNAAIVLAKLGVRASVCCRVGDDFFGRFVSESLAGHGVDPSGLIVDPTRATSQSLIVNVKGQDRRFIHSFGANQGFSAADLDRSLAGNPRVLYVGGYLVMPGLDPDELAERFARARRAGITTVLDVVTPGPGPHLDHLRPVLRETDVFLPNTDEAALILGEPDPIRQALAFHDLGARRVVVTRGEHGSIAVSDQLRARIGAYPVTFVDGTGGGDAFDAGYIAGLIEGLPEVECLKMASAVGASCVRAVGTTAGIFAREKVGPFMAAHPIAVEAF